MVHAVGKHDQRFAALLLAHQLVGSEENRVVELRSAAVHVAALPASASRTAVPASAVTAAPVASAAIVLRRRQRLQRGLQLGPRGSEILQQLDLAVEVNHEG